MYSIFNNTWLCSFQKNIGFNSFLNKKIILLKKLRIKIVLLKIKIIIKILVQKRKQIIKQKEKMAMLALIKERRILKRNKDLLKLNQ